MPVAIHFHNQKSRNSAVVVESSKLCNDKIAKSALILQTVRCYALVADIDQKHVATDRPDEHQSDPTVTQTVHGRGLPCRNVNTLSSSHIP